MGLTITEPIKRNNLHLTPKYLKKKKVRSTHEAMVVLSNVYGKEIKRGKEVAQTLAAQHGTVSARQVIHAMVEEGSLIDGSLPEHWISVVFRSRKIWEWTGDVAEGRTKNTQGGVRWSKVWRLRHLPK